MMHLKSTLLVLVLLLSLTACGEPAVEPVPDAGPAAAAAGVPDTDISLWQGSVFDDPTPAAVAPVVSMPGNNEKVARLFEGAPPVVPHGVDDFLPITVDENACMECHFAEEPEEEDAPQLPDSHKTDLRVAPDTVGATVAGGRWICTACHVARTDVAPLAQGSAPESAE